MHNTNRMQSTVESKLLHDDVLGVEFMVEKHDVSLTFYVGSAFLFVVAYDILDRGSSRERSPYSAWLKTTRTIAAKRRRLLLDGKGFISNLTVKTDCKGFR